MNKEDCLVIWGQLQTLKDLLEQKARTLSAEGGDDKLLFAGHYLKECAKSPGMQWKIENEVEDME